MWPLTPLAFLQTPRLWLIIKERDWGRGSPPDPHPRVFLCYPAEQRCSVWDSAPPLCSRGIGQHTAAPRLKKPPQRGLAPSDRLPVTLWVGSPPALVGPWKGTSPPLTGEGERGREGRCHFYWKDSLEITLKPRGPRGEKEVVQIFLCWLDGHVFIFFPCRSPRVWHLVTTSSTGGTGHIRPGSCGGQGWLVGPS